MQTQDTAGTTTGRPARRPVLRRPPGLVEQTRWLFYLCALASLVLVLPAALAGPHSASRLLGATATVLLAGSWTYRYLTRAAPLPLDLTDALAATALALSGFSPVVAYGVTFSAVWFRAVYGSTSRVALHGLGTALGVAAAMPLWGLVPGHAASTPASPVLAALPTLVLMVAVARHLALGLFAREQTQHRDAALALLGNSLLTVTDPATISARGWETAVAICTATPDLRLLLLTTGRDGLRVTRSAGSFAQLPDLLTGTALPAPAGPVGAAQPVSGTDELTAAAGFPGTWLCLSPLERSGTRLLVGAPRAVPHEALSALQSAINLSTLAMRNSDAHRDLTTQAATDSLTGLANRASFLDALDQGLRDPAAQLVVLFLDLDDFKDVNDGLGHSAGDELLRHVAGQLRLAVRPGDLCARLGGDEFAVLLRAATSDGAFIVGERLVQLVAAPVRLRGGPAQVGASVGLAHSSTSSSATELVQQADIAMYAAKAKGKNRVQEFHHSLLDADAEAGTEAGVERDLPVAVEAAPVVPPRQPLASLGPPPRPAR